VKKRTNPEYDENVLKAFREIAAMKKVIVALAKLSPEKRTRVLEAAATLYGFKFL
jgi:hypothetical protein